jgi:DNA-directed RNA polymerase specialized sigma24 family protein
MEDLDLLVQAAQQGDNGAFGHIVNRFQHMAYASAYAQVGDFHLAQDVAQEAFIDAYLSLGNLRQPAAFPGWFRRFVVKHSDRVLRKSNQISLDPEKNPDDAFRLARPGSALRTATAATKR